MRSYVKSTKVETGTWPMNSTMPKTARRISIPGTAVRFAVPGCCACEPLLPGGRVSRRRLALSTRVIPASAARSEEHTSELQSRGHLVCRLLLEKKKNNKTINQLKEDLED